MKFNSHSLSNHEQITSHLTTEEEDAGHPQVQEMPNSSQESEDLAGMRRPMSVPPGAPLQEQQVPHEGSASFPKEFHAPPLNL